MRRFRRILVPVDFSSCSRLALEHALSLAHAYEASLDIVHVWSPHAYPPSWLYASVPTGGIADSEIQMKAEEAAKEGLGAFLEDLEPPPGVQFEARTELGSPAEVITRLSTDYDLIVMGTHGRTGLTRIVLGSVATRVVSRAECPVLTVRQPEEKPERKAAQREERPPPSR